MLTEFIDIGVTIVLIDYVTNSREVGMYTNAYHKQEYSYVSLAPAKLPQYTE